MPRSLKYPLPFRLLAQTVHVFLIITLRATYSVHPTLLDFIPLL
jgi:hypothetical protein